MVVRLLFVKNYNSSKITIGGQSVNPEFCFL
jgi:hypothetical protein